MIIIGQSLETRTTSEKTKSWRFSLYQAITRNRDTRVPAILIMDKHNQHLHQEHDHNARTNQVVSKEDTNDRMSDPSEIDDCSSCTTGKYALRCPRYKLDPKGHDSRAEAQRSAIDSVRRLYAGNIIKPKPASTKQSSNSVTSEACAGKASSKASTCVSSSKSSFRKA